MEITAKQYEKVKGSLPTQRRNEKLLNLEVLNSILYVPEKGCKSRGFRRGVATGTGFMRA
jgi:hypothetical protein